jgi:hypothetical protein
VCQSLLSLAHESPFCAHLGNSAVRDVDGLKCTMVGIFTQQELADAVNPGLMFAKDMVIKTFTSIPLVLLSDLPV